MSTLIVIIVTVINLGIDYKIVHMYDDFVPM